eukprot:gene3904-4518_t
MTVAVKDESSFHQLFQSLPTDEKLIEEYSCSYNEGGSVSIGRLYISQYHVSYAPKIGSTQIVIPIKDISSISKKYSVYLFPNAIEVITTKEQKYFFSAFLSRDLAFATLSTIIHAGGGTRTKIFEDALIANEEKEKEKERERERIKSSLDDISEPDEPFTDTPTLSSFQPSNKSLVVGEQSPSTSSDENVSPPAGSNSPPSISPSPSSKMLASKIETTDNNVTDERTDIVSSSDDAIIPPPASISNATNNANTTTTTTTSAPTTPVVATPKKPEPPPKRQESSQSLPVDLTSPAKRKPTESTVVAPPASPLKTSQTLPATPATATAPVTTTTTTPQTASPSPTSVVVSPALSFASLPMQPSCEHIFMEFEDQPWCTEKFPVSVEEFYNIIVRSDFWAQVNTTHLYTEQTVSEWKTSTPCCLTRQMDFRTAISFKIGPKSTRVSQIQRCRLKSKREMLISASSVSKDVPYGDSFSIENLLAVTAEDTGCVVKLSSKVKFTKTLWGIASMIQKSGTQGNKDFFVLWFSMVRNQIEAYSFNKTKQSLNSSLKSALPEPTPTIQPALPEKVAVAEIPLIKMTSEILTPTPTHPHPVGPSNISLTSLWNNMSMNEMLYIGIFLAIISLFFIGLSVNVSSNSQTNQMLSNELYKFSDSIILLDAKLNALATGAGPIDDKVIIASGNIGTDRLETLQRRLDIASSLLQRASSVVSSLQGELAIESMKNKKAQDIIDASSYGWTPLIVSILIVGFTYCYYTGLLKSLREKLPF